MTTFDWLVPALSVGFGICAVVWAKWSDKRFVAKYGDEDHPAE